jgi:4-hydroxy-tetrahydrodipicolinate synthase
LIAHFTAIADASPLPVILYDVPVRTGRRLLPSSVVELAKNVENIVALKDAAGDVAASAELIAELDEEFEVYCGDDILTLPFLAVGAVGVVSVAGHWAAASIARVIDAFERGDVVEARELNAQMYPTYRFVGFDDAPNPLPVKAMMRVLGLSVGECRLPLGPAPDWLESRAREVLASLR